jgi:homospermidine synthase
MTSVKDILVEFPGRILIVGFGSIGQGVLPLILRHIGVAPGRITIVTADELGHGEADDYGIRFINEPLTPANYRRLLDPLLGPGDFLLNVSVGVATAALVAYCRERGALYLDTVIEPWEGSYVDPGLAPAKRTNYALREEALALRAGNDGAPTAVITLGANPGLVSLFVKQALLDLAAQTGHALQREPASRREWATLSRDLGVKVVHVAERDTQIDRVRKQPDEFVNTWSVDGFVNEGCQPAELGWGTHERHFPPDGRRQETGNGAAIYLERPGAATQVRTWTPLAGSIHGFLITHGEAISLPDYFTLREDGRVAYRPTVHYAYHPCDDAVLSLHELAGRNWRLQGRTRIMKDDIVSGIDELGVLVCGHRRNAYWYGSRLSVEEARRLAPHNSATSLQVTAACLAGMVWAIENPRRGLVEPEEVDFRRILDICRPYLGELVGVYTDWTPLQDRGLLFPEELDRSDPWQFRNVRVC